MSNIITPDNYTDGNFKPGQFNPAFLMNLKPVLEQVLAGNPDARNRPEFTCLNLKSVQAALDWLANNELLTNEAKADLALNSWRLTYRSKPPTPEEFLTPKYIGSMAESLYPHIKKAFIEFMDPLKPYRTVVLYSAIGSGKAQPLDSLVAVDYKDIINIDLGKKILRLLPDELITIRYNNNRITIKAAELVNLDLSKVDLPDPLIKKFSTNLIMKVYNVDKYNFFSEAKNLSSYDEIISYFKQFNDKQYYDSKGIHCHLHHIIPRSMGGKDDSDNLVYLPYQYHIKAHYFLGRELECKGLKREALYNYKAVLLALKETSVPKSIIELESKLDFVLESLEKRNYLEKQTFWIKKEGQPSIKIFKDELESFEQAGWVRGRTFKNPSGKVWVNKDQKNYYILKEELSQYLSDGYSQGMYKTQKMKNSNHVSYSTKGTKWMTSPDGKAKAIKAEKVDEMLALGWSLGHPRFVYTKGHPHKKQGFHWYNNGVESKLALESPGDNWVRGRLK